VFFSAAIKTSILAEVIKYSDISASKDIQLWQVLLPPALCIIRRVKEKKVSEIVDANLFDLFTAK
jgi:hypothetical protein